MELHKRNLPPCKDCADRTVGCHSKCSGFLNWKQRHDLIIAEKLKIRKAVNDFENYHNIALEQSRKRGGK